MMNKLRLVLAIIFVLSLTLFAMPPVNAATDNPGLAPDRILVKFKAGTDAATEQDIHSRHGGSVVGEIRQLGVKIVTIPNGRALEKVNVYRNEQAVEFAEPDYIAQAIVTPDDPYFTNQWGMTTIQAPAAWDITTGSATIKIAVLDTGVDRDHPDLAGKVVAYRNFTTSKTDDDLYGHGTHVAGIAAAVTNNGTGVAGVGYNSVILNGKVLGDNGSGFYSWIASGITWATDQGAKVINMSLGGTAGSGALASAVDYAWGKGVVVVAAAGNSNTDALFYPASYTNCIAVAASDLADSRASFSNYGSWVDVAGPGVSIYSTMPNHANQFGPVNYGYLSGTSMASPYVAGLAALVWTTAYNTSNSSVRNRIETTADQAGNLWSNYGIERINAFKAVAPSGPPDNTAPVITNVQSVPAATSATVTWTTDEAADSTVDYGQDTSYGSSKTNAALGTGHSITITGLSPATTYHYRVSSRDGAGNLALSEDDTFTTITRPIMGVSSVTVNLVTRGKDTLAQATVSVKSNGAPVAGATVSGQWSEATSDSDTGITTQNGEVVLSSDKVRRPVKGTRFTFTVTSVSHPDYSWDEIKRSGDASVP